MCRVSMGTLFYPSRLATLAARFRNEILNFPAAQQFISGAQLSCSHLQSELRNPRAGNVGGGLWCWCCVVIRRVYACVRVHIYMYVILVRRDDTKLQTARTDITVYIGIRSNECVYSTSARARTAAHRSISFGSESVRFQPS